ncbi:MAG: preprotein translocase subunit YajC [Flavobacteriales bacterium]|nr:preprotein translocase subunit YajC [Flavobacteriales bacterium]MCB9168182.1 preprotein translocase subunit YajC [Flavobacteriales bacterium]MCB9194253.1 preprotein translocase subunit YajC [Flavobacteriales bacterium]
MTLLQAQQNPTSFWIMMGLLMVVFYFFMIRPQQKKAREAKKFRESIQKGAKVVTIGGIHGKVMEVSEKSVLLEVDSNTKIRVERSALAMDSSQQLTEANARS